MAENVRGQKNSMDEFERREQPGINDSNYRVVASDEKQSVETDEALYKRDEVTRQEGIEGRAE
jgi:hypothetical protein